MNALDSAPTTAHVSTPAGRVIGIPEGTRLLFGRGPDVDLVISAGRGLSRRAGAITAAADGAWVANIGVTHALYVEGDGYRIRLPRMDEPGEPYGGWFLRQGTALVGSRAMLDEGQPLRLVVAATGEAGADAAGAAARAGGDPTLLPLYLDPNTKLFLVALMWCRPWLIDPARSTPLPRTPEIARAALEVTDAHHEIACFGPRPRFPRPAVRAGRRASQGAAPQDRRARPDAFGGPPVRRGRRGSADRERSHRPRRPGPSQRPSVVLAPGGPVVDVGPGGGCTTKLVTALVPPAQVTTTL